MKVHQPLRRLVVERKLLALSKPILRAYALAYVSNTGPGVFSSALGSDWEEDEW